MQMQPPISTAQAAAPHPSPFTAAEPSSSQLNRKQQPGGSLFPAPSIVPPRRLLRQQDSTHALALCDSLHQLL